MLRVLGFVFVVTVCVEMAPWGLVVGAILFLGWAFLQPAPLRSHDEQLRMTGNKLLSAIPLTNAVYCVNCNLITNSPHDSCGVCGSHSVVGVLRAWQATSAEPHIKAGRYRISLTADIHEIPADGLNETTKLVSRLAELGGDVKACHIEVEPVFSSGAIPIDTKIEVLTPAKPINSWQQVRQAS